MTAKKLLGYPLRDGIWPTDYTIEHRIEAIDRAEAIIFSKAPRPRDGLRMLLQHGAELQRGDPVIISGAFLYAICNAWIGPILGSTLPRGLKLAFRFPVVSGQQLNAKCTMREVQLEHNRIRALLELAIHVVPIPRPACTGTVVICQRNQANEVLSSV